MAFARVVTVKEFLELEKQKVEFEGMLKAFNSLRDEHLKNLDAYKFDRTLFRQYVDCNKLLKVLCDSYQRNPMTGTLDLVRSQYQELKELKGKLDVVYNSLASYDFESKSKELLDRHRKIRDYASSITDLEVKEYFTKRLAGRAQAITAIEKDSQEMCSKIKKEFISDYHKMNAKFSTYTQLVNTLVSSAQSAALKFNLFAFKPHEEEKEASIRIPALTCSH